MRKIDADFCRQRFCGADGHLPAGEGACAVFDGDGKLLGDLKDLIRISCLLDGD